MEVCEAYERHTSTKAKHCEEYPKADKSWFGYEDETPILTISSSTPPCAVSSECGLLVDLSESPAVPIAPVKFAQPLADPLLALIKDNCAASTAAAGPSDAADVIGDLLGERPSSNSLSNVNASPSIHCSTSASNIQKSSAALDPFAELLSQFVNSTGSKQASAASFTTSVPSRAKYSRTPMEHWNRSATARKPKMTGDVFVDLLASHGFTTSSKNAARTLGDLKRAEEIKELDPVAVMIRDWTVGKERNIRALLSSLNEVLWEGAESWEQSRMSDLLTAAQVKRNYHKACLVVHPDKQVGKPHEKLAVAIFTELNSAWNIFEEAGNRSL
ncbi:DnaJ domain protein [Teladorsagia circumcincta]|uniref:DnaJ domain protein n=1 Tax=Teladorsagia circumcincta TaxID=45464 RepID=A0A2G9V269_TELCI|nr:DnaJ domain protein [Teladorsagia circumcincta]